MTSCIDAPVTVEVDWSILRPCLKRDGEAGRTPASDE